MRSALWLSLAGGLLLWGLAMQRQLDAARKRGDMYRDAAARLDRRLFEQSRPPAS